MAELERVGEGEQAPGYLLLGLLSLQGWHVAVTGRDDGEEGVTVSAVKPGRLGELSRKVERSGESVGAVVVDLVTDVLGEAPEIEQPWWAR